MTYTFKCSQGHDPVTFTVEAENDDEAFSKIMDATKGHLTDVHPDMAGMSPEDARQIITSSWTKSES